MFLLQLSVHTGWTMEQIEMMPNGLIEEYIVLNSVKPFLPEAQAHREALLTSLIYNQNAKKEHRKSSHELFPYLKPGLPTWLEDEMVIKAKDYLRSLHIHLALGSEETYISNLKNAHKAIEEQIEIEKKEKNKDNYRIQELQKILENSYKENKEILNKGA